MTSNNALAIMDNNANSEPSSLKVININISNSCNLHRIYHTENFLLNFFA